jgi:lysozyme family protein
MTAFEKWVTRIIHVEGGYVNAKNDSGGATKYGITEKVARKEGYTGAMQHLPIDIAKVIYKRSYWDKLRLDDISVTSESIAFEIGDTFVNTGIGGIFLQRMLNVLNRQARDYMDLAIDGNIGPATISALRSFLVARGSEGESVILAGLNALQAHHYITLAERREVSEQFIYGWMLNRVVKPS